MTYLLKFIIGVLILSSVVFVHELCHYIPAKIMGLNPSFDVFKGKFRVQTHNINEKQALIVGLMPIPFVAIWIFMALVWLTDFANIINHKMLCLVLMILLAIGSSIIISFSDIRTVLNVIH